MKKKNHPWLTVRSPMVIGGVKNYVLADVTEMIISGPIGKSWWDDSGTSSKEFREAFNAIPKGTKVAVRINSEGGSVSDALEIYNVLQTREEDVTCYNDGYALSSASIILLGGAKSVCPASSITMIHEPWSMTVGDEGDHLKAANMLAKHGDTIAAIYATKTGKPADEMREAMKEESWFTGAEAVEFGLADKAEEEEDVLEDSFKALDLAPFRNVPEHIKEMVQGRKQISTPAMAAVNNPAKPDKPQLMDKTKILAALKERGIELPADATEETILAAFNKLSVEDATKAGDAGEIKALREQLEAEKRVRITAEVKRRGENRIENKNLTWWINLAMSDEVNVFAQIDALPVARPGGDPVPAGHSAEVLANRWEEIKKEPVALKRFVAMKRDWPALIADAVSRDTRQRQMPMMANTYSASLVTQFLLDGCVTKLQNRWAALRVFSKDYSPDRYKPRATAQLKYATAGGATQKNATNFEAGNSTVTNVQIAVDQYSNAFNVTNDELNSGLRMENLIDVNTAALADNILAVAFAPLAKASFTTNAHILSGAAAFSFSDMATAWGELKKSPVKYAVLDGEYMARIINTPVFYQATGTEQGGEDGWKRFGWDGVYLNTNWTGTVAGANSDNIRGLFCNPQVIGAVAGLPLTPPSVPGSVLTESTISVPDVDISVAAYSWFSLATRTMWMSYDLMFGTALLDESAGVLLASS